MAIAWKTYCLDPRYRCVLSPKSTQKQEFIGKSQQKNESLALVGTIPASLCQQMPFSALWLWTEKSLLISQCDLGLMIQNHYNVMPKISPREKKAASLLSFMMALSMDEVWKKEKQGWHLAFMARKFVYLFLVTLQGFLFWKSKRKIFVSFSWRWGRGQRQKPWAFLHLPPSSSWCESLGKGESSV